MRIISGKAKSRIIKFPRLKKIRPTTDRVKEALFNILGEQVVGAYFLELFAGSGSVGVESLSRGAKEVVFVDNDNKCIKTIRENVKVCLQPSEGVISALEASDCIARNASGPAGTKVNLSSSCRATCGRVALLRLDALKAIELLHKRREKFNIIFLDPPYYQGWVKKSLINISRYDILKRNAVIIAEHSRKDSLGPDFEGLRLVQQRKYSDTILSFYKKIATR